MPFSPSKPTSRTQYGWRDPVFGDLERRPVLSTGLKPGKVLNESATELTSRDICHSAVDVPRVPSPTSDPRRGISISHTKCPDPNRKCPQTPVAHWARYPPLSHPRIESCTVFDEVRELYSFKLPKQVNESIKKEFVVKSKLKSRRGRVRAVCPIHNQHGTTRAPSVLIN